MKLNMFPDDVINKYNLCDKVEPDGYVYIEARKGMFGLPQAGLLTQELLAERLAKHGYNQSEVTPGLWTHKWRPICFYLVMDNFVIKYVGQEHADHLISALKEMYELEVDTEGAKYVASLYTGTMPRARSICPCRDTWQRPYAISRISGWVNPRISLMHTSHLIMAPRCSTHLMTTRHDQPPKKRKHLSNRLLGLSCITVVLLMVPC